jgi:hypothetical protein
MDIALAPEADVAVAEAVRTAVSRAGIAPGPSSWASAWWRAGLVEATDRRPAGEAEPCVPGYEAAVPGYEAARSPRSTRGATRA